MGPIQIDRESSTIDSRRMRSKSKQRYIFIAGVVGVLAIGFVFAHTTIQALQFRAANSSVFAKYVLVHHIGQAKITDDASGFQTDICVLQLNHPIAETEVELKALQLMKQYHQQDGGTNLTIEYAKANGKEVIQASAEYNESSGTVNLTFLQNGVEITRAQKVVWTNPVTS